MKLEKQICSLEQTRKLKELGVIQESLFYIIDNYVLGIEGIKMRHELRSVKDGGLIKYYSCFTVSELGAMLTIDYTTSFRTTSEWQACKYDPESNSYGNHFLSQTQAGAMCDLLIFLLENKYILVAECNERLIS